MQKLDFFNGESLPMALSENENLYYHNKYLSGDMSAREILIKHNLKLVIFVVIKNFFNVGYELEDLVSVGILGLIKGIEKFDVLESENISSYLSGCIIYEILNFLRNENKYKKRGIKLVSIDDIGIEKDGDYVCNRDLFDVMDESIEDIVVNKMMDEYYQGILYEMLSMLNDRDRMIFMLYFGFVDGKLYKQREIASMVGIDRGAVSMSLYRNLKKMRESLMFLENRRILCKK